MAINGTNVRLFLNAWTQMLLKRTINILFAKCKVKKMVEDALVLSNIFADISHELIGTWKCVVLKLPVIFSVVYSMQ